MPDATEAKVAKDGFSARTYEDITLVRLSLSRGGGEHTRNNSQDEGHHEAQVDLSCADTQGRVSHPLTGLTSWSSTRLPMHEIRTYHFTHSLRRVIVQHLGEIFERTPSLHERKDHHWSVTFFLTIHAQ